MVSNSPQRQLIDTYRALPAIEQEIIQLFSVVYDAITRTAFLNLLNQCRVRDQSGNPFTSSSLKSIVDRQLRDGLLIQEGTRGLHCVKAIAEVAMRDAARNGTLNTFVQQVRKDFPIRTLWKNGPLSFQSVKQFMREARIALYLHDAKHFYKLFEDYERYGYMMGQLSPSTILLQICNNPFDPDWMGTLSTKLFEDALLSILTHSEAVCAPVDAPFALLEEECHKPGGRCSEALRLALIRQYLLRGRFDDAEATLNFGFQEYGDDANTLRAWLTFLRGQNQEAIALYTSALKTLRKSSGKRQVFFNTKAGLFFILALLKDGSPERLHEAEEYTNIVTRKGDHWLTSVYAQLHHLLRFQQGDASKQEMLTQGYNASLIQPYSVVALVQALCFYWGDREFVKTRLPKVLEPFYTAAETAGYDWLALELGELLSRLKPKGKYGKAIANWRSRIGTSPLADLIQPQEVWELSLKALENLAQTSPTHAQSKSAEGEAVRMAWFVSLMGGYCSISPREQRLSAKGIWGTGRAVALKRLVERSKEFSYLTPQDRQVCAQLHPEGAAYYGQLQYRFGEQAIAALVGHPYVFWEDSPTTRVEVVKGEPELLVKKGKDDKLRLEFSPQPKETQELIVIKETPTRIKVIEITENHRRIAAIIGPKNQLEIPTAAKEKVLAAISAVSGIVTVHSDIGGGHQNAEAVPADAKPHIHLLPAGDGLKVSVLARPFAHGGPYFRPGTGGETVIAEIDGKRLQTTRQLKEEKQRAMEAIAACPILEEYSEAESEWLIEEPEDCLELLLELQALDDSVVVEWPEGEKLRVSHPRDMNSFKLKIQQQNDWFAASGELALDDESVLDMQRLMELLDRSSGRFLPLGDGQFVALTQSFRKRLDELRAFSENHGKGVRFHPLAALALEDLMDEAGSLEADKHWNAHVKRLKELDQVQPTVPSTLQAELRDYQVEGFRWLSRLAHWGVGACLADDMGLGKTLQALALILSRAADGPTLVVAPTSVCMNWISEAQRFAPTLNVIQFGSGDRQSTLNNLQPFDLLVCSYGLLQQDEVGEMLAKVQWQTVVLDEAQAIKNVATKRSQAAMKLQAGFKLITTGTPIENHLGELWNLFRFINPGLLGSMERFNQTFATPIERYQDKNARLRLKKLIQPFILRRTKSQVLDELPSRTEILLHVELSREEMALYEALRREAIARLSESDATAGAKHLQVLAEIMKLRRMCCNPRLVKTGVDLPSSKLNLFGEVLTELLANQHKSLVFSQFVDHLQIIREYLDEHHIQYQYLDGSTPAKERKRRVDAFQKGEGDVFLISLKAGGTGLNLTAADYVIHMDPWWNPAVEDQASDRAHRIGQQRPVTIYRLVAKNTIEEKIVELHHHKRDLADSLLEGTDASGKISTDQLLELIQVG